MGEKLTGDMPKDLRALLLESYRLECTKALPIFNGDEARVWRVTSSDGDFVVHLGPPWRRPDELAWVHRVACFAARQVPEVVPPIATGSGETFIPYGDALVAVYRFVEGIDLSRDDDEELSAAAELLARIHTALLDFPDQRPALSPSAPQARKATDEPPELSDEDLDRWMDEVGGKLWTKGIVHGDYYRRNLICRDHRIVGVIDWHEAGMRPLISELAFATWEAAHDEDMRFLPTRAKLFVDAYVEAGPIEPWEYEALLPWMRLGLRANIRYGLDSARLGAHEDRAYVAKELAAFRALKDMRLA
jgi:Ser/Thr protein kinase RdoA (MazF antagonist)